MNIRAFSVLCSLLLLALLTGKALGVKPTEPVDFDCVVEDDQGNVLCRGTDKPPGSCPCTTSTEADEDAPSIDIAAGVNFHVDFRPGICPNPLNIDEPNPGNQGNVHAAITSGILCKNVANGQGGAPTKVCTTNVPAFTAVEDAAECLPGQICIDTLSLAMNCAGGSVTPTAFNVEDNSQPRPESQILPQSAADCIAGEDDVDDISATFSKAAVSANAEPALPGDTQFCTIQALITDRSGFIGPDPVTIMATGTDWFTIVGNDSVQPPSLSVCPGSSSPVDPDKGSTDGGTEVKICGENFASATVEFDSNVGEVIASSGTQLTVLTPLGTAGTVVDVTVTNFDGQSATAFAAFTYVPPPSITSITPNIGANTGDTEVIIDGSDFANDVTVKFGNAEADIVLPSSSTSIKVMTPTCDEATGSSKCDKNSSVDADVTVINNDSGLSTTVVDGFTYDD